MSTRNTSTPAADTAETPAAKVATAEDLAKARKEEAAKHREAKEAIVARRPELDAQVRLGEVVEYPLEYLEDRAGRGLSLPTGYSFNALAKPAFFLTAKAEA